MQDKINAFSKVIVDELKPQDAYKHTDPNSKQVLKLTKFTEVNKITSFPPALLVLRVENHVVDPAKDCLVNCSTLFASKLKPEDAQYELAGFAQNHGQVHWTSVVNHEGVWNYCNDDQVHDVKESDENFTHPANYLVYRKKH